MKSAIYKYYSKEAISSSNKDCKTCCSSIMLFRIFFTWFTEDVGFKLLIPLENKSIFCLLLILCQKSKN